MDEYPREEALNLREYWYIIRKRLWLILAILIIASAYTFVSSMLTKPVYRATAQILIERDKPQVVKVEEVMALDAYSKDYYATQCKLLKSRSLAREVIKKLGLDQHRVFNPKPQKSWSSFKIRQTLASVVPRKRSPLDPLSSEVEYDHLTRYVNAYLDMLDIEPMGESRLVNISFEGGDPTLAASMANTHAQAFIDKDLERKLSATEEAVKWLTGRLDELKEKLRQSEEALQLFKEQENIVALENILSADGRSEESIIVRKLAELNSNLATARTERLSLEILHNQLKTLSKKPGMAESIPQVNQNGLIQNLKSNYIELDQQYSELQGNYRNNHPRMIDLRRVMKNLRSRIGIEVDKIVKGVEIQYKMALAKEKNLRDSLDRTKSEIVGLNKKAIQYGMLKREVESNREIYQMILRRAKETSLTSRLKSTNIFIVDRAEIPRAPVKQQVWTNLLLAAVITLMLGFGLALSLEHLDNTFHGPDDVKRYLGVPFLGPVSLAPKKNGDPSLDLVALQGSRSRFAESLRNVRTNLVFSLVEPDQKALAITSAGPEEGKTLIASNLAVITARTGRRVLLVDADLRKPDVHRLFGIRLEPGLSNLVAGTCRLRAATRDTSLNRLKVMPAGTIPPNPSELLASRMMLKLVNKLKEYFDLLIFDTPPILTVTDAAVLSGMLDGTTLVVKASETPRDAAKQAIEQINDVHARVLGIVLNQVDFTKEGYCYSYYHKNCYYYTDTGGEAASPNPYKQPDETSAMGPGNLLSDQGMRIMGLHQESRLRELD
jgi:capsular exopolysaccharide synthesis family protein